MCGIAGIYRFGSGSIGEDERREDHALVKAMLGAIAYRGPDDEGIENLGRATLGARRLSIIDVEGGHQPLSDAARRVWAVQNGELYNFPALRRELSQRHAFRTRSDTEILPHLWLERGKRCVEALSGMFAAAIYDTREESLLLARDPLGVKPLYVTESAGRLIFASEVKALLRVPFVARDLDPQAIERFLALGYVPGQRTILKSIRKVRPGTRLIVTPDGVTRERYWAWPRFLSDPPQGRPNDEALADRASDMLARSIESMLLSDRPLGVLLSGGVDSSVLVALLPEDIRRTTRTFAIGFTNGGYHDERAHARVVAQHLGSRHQESVVDLELSDELPGVVGFLDEPCADPAAVPAHLVARAASEHVTVLLSGTGGDEVFGGYRRYRLHRMLEMSRWIPRGIARQGARFLEDRNQNRKSRGAEQLVMLRKLLQARGREGFFSAYLSAFEPASPARWSDAVAAGLRPGSVPAKLWDEMVEELGEAPKRPEAIAFAADHLYYLPDDLLLKEDRTTMGASVEGRVPFLDPELVRFAAGLPLATRFTDGEGKQLLRRIARRHLPEAIAARRKHGFSVPIEDWFRGPLRTMATDVFSGNSSGVFRREVLLRWLEEHQQMRDRSGPLWAALSFELWWQRVGSQPPAPIDTPAGAPD